MCDQLMLPPTEPPDLLRRFVATPHEKSLRSGDLRLLVKTNDGRLLRVVDGTDDDGSGSRPEWTMVADADMPPELGDALVLHGAATSFLSFGRACYVAIDHEKKEITGFVSAGISDDDWSNVILPAVADIWRTASGATEVVAERRQ